MKSKRYAYSQTGFERAIRAIPRTPPKMGALWMNGKMVRYTKSTHLTRSGVIFNKLLCLHRRGE
jgi:hypothetical protein